MRVVVNPDRRRWSELTKRSLPDDNTIEARVKTILKRVKEDGDEALKLLAQEIDNVKLNRIEVTEDVVEKAVQEVSPTLKKAIEIAAENIKKFHQAQIDPELVVETMPGLRCVQRSVAINRVGIYIPAGSAPLFSTVLMLAIPAKVAGCKEVILTTPPSKAGIPAPEILYAAKLCGVDKIFLSGGAQAIAAMAYGTKTVPKVDKIFGPGNRYVTKAKQLVSVSDVAIDMPAGPSEVMVLADQTANPSFVAADLLSQAEHGEDSQAILATDSRSFAEQVNIAIEEQLKAVERDEISRKALENSYIVVMDREETMIDFANDYAAEHLIISMENPWDISQQITSAGSIFIGNYSPESAGDYASGTNHTLPTAGWAKSYSGVNTNSFIKKITIQELSKEALEELGPTIMTMANAEGLDAHAKAVKIRLDTLK